MDNGNTAIKSLLEEETDINLEKTVEPVNFDEINDLKTIQDMVEGDNPFSKKEEVEASREYIRQFVNNPHHVLAKGTQGSGKSKAVIVAIYYLIEHGRCMNFVYSAKSYDQKLDEVWEDVNGKGGIIDPFTGKEIEFGSEVKTRFLKGLDKLMDEEREARGLPKNEPLSIFVDRETEEKTEFAEVCDKVGRQEALKYAEDPEDDFDVLKEWRNTKNEVRDLAKTDNPLIVITPNAMRKTMSIFSKQDWDSYADEIAYEDRNTRTLDLDGGTARELKEGKVFREETDDELINKAEILGKAMEMILEGCKDFSLNNMSQKEVKKSEMKAWRQQIKRNDKKELHISRRVDLFEGGALGLDDGVDRGMMRFTIDNIYHPGRYWKSIYDGTKSLPELIESEVEALLEEGEIEQAGRVNDLKWLWNTIRDMERYGVFMNEKHDYGSEEVKSGLTPHKIDREKQEALLMTLKHDFDNLFDQGFKDGNRLRILSASVEEEWFRRKVDRYERANNLADEDLNDYFEYVAPELEENFQIKKVERWQKGSWAMGKRSGEFSKFSGAFRPYIEGDENRHAVIPKNMKKKYNWDEESVNCWNSDVLGSNDAEGKDELFLCYTYVPPEIESVMTYVDIEGEFPSLEYEQGNSQIPEEYVEVEGRQRTGYRNPDVEGESSLSVAYKCQIETHIDDAVRRLRELHDEDKTVYLMCQPTQNIEEMHDRVEEIRTWELLADMIMETEGGELDRFVGETKNELIKWITEEGFDLGSPADKTAEEIGKRMNWIVVDEVIEKQQTEEERLTERMPKDKWLSWNEVREKSPFGHERSKEIISSLEEVEVEEKEKPGPADDKIEKYKF
jgi:hypothetical protein